MQIDEYIINSLFLRGFHGPDVVSQVTPLPSVWSVSNYQFFLFGFSLVLCSSWFIAQRLHFLAWDMGPREQDMKYLGRNRCAMTANTVSLSPNKRFRTWIKDAVRRNFTTPKVAHNDHENGTSDARSFEETWTYKTGDARSMASRKSFTGTAAESGLSLSATDQGGKKTPSLGRKPSEITNQSNVYQDGHERKRLRAKSTNHVPVIDSELIKPRKPMEPRTRTTSRSGDVRGMGKTVTVSKQRNLRTPSDLSFTPSEKASRRRYRVNSRQGDESQYPGLAEARVTIDEFDEVNCLRADESQELSFFCKEQESSQSSNNISSSSWTTRPSTMTMPSSGESLRWGIKRRNTKRGKRKRKRTTERSSSYTQSSVQHMDIVKMYTGQSNSTVTVDQAVLDLLSGDFNSKREKCSTPYQNDSINSFSVIRAHNPEDRTPVAWQQEPLLQKKSPYRINRWGRVDYCSNECGERCPVWEQAPSSNHSVDELKAYTLEAVPTASPGARYYQKHFDELGPCIPSAILDVGRAQRECCQDTHSPSQSSLSADMSRPLLLSPSGMIHESSCNYYLTSVSSTVNLVEQSPECFLGDSKDHRVRSGNAMYLCAATRIGSRNKYRLYNRVENVEQGSIFNQDLPLPVKTVTVKKTSDKSTQIKRLTTEKTMQFNSLDPEPTRNGGPLLKKHAKFENERHAMRDSSQPHPRHNLKRARSSKPESKRIEAVDVIAELSGSNDEYNSGHGSINQACTVSLSLGAKKSPKFRDLTNPRNVKKPQEERIVVLRHAPIRAKYERKPKAVLHTKIGAAPKLRNSPINETQKVHTRYVKEQPSPGKRFSNDQAGATSVVSALDRRNVPRPPRTGDTQPGVTQPFIDQEETRHPHGALSQQTQTHIQHAKLTSKMTNSLSFKGDTMTGLHKDVMTHMEDSFTPARPPSSTVRQDLSPAVGHIRSKGNIFAQQVAEATPRRKTRQVELCVFLKRPCTESSVLTSRDVPVQWESIYREVRKVVAFPSLPDASSSYVKHPRKQVVQKILCRENVKNQPPNKCPRNKDNQIPDQRASLANRWKSIAVPDSKKQVFRTQKKSCCDSSIPTFRFMDRRNPTFRKCPEKSAGANPNKIAGKGPSGNKIKDVTHKAVSPFPKLLKQRPRMPRYTLPIRKNSTPRKNNLKDESDNGKKKEASSIGCIARKQQNLRQAAQNSDMMFNIVETNSTKCRKSQSLSTLDMLSNISFSETLKRESRDMFINPAETCLGMLPEGRPVAAEQSHAGLARATNGKDSGTFHPSSKICMIESLNISVESRRCVLQDIGDSNKSDKTIRSIQTNKSILRDFHSQRNRQEEHGQLDKAYVTKQMAEACTQFSVQETDFMTSDRQHHCPNSTTACPSHTCHKNVIENQAKDEQRQEWRYQENAGETGNAKRESRMKSRIPRYVRASPLTPPSKRFVFKKKLSSVTAHTHTTHRGDIGHIPPTAYTAHTANPTHTASTAHALPKAHTAHAAPTAHIAHIDHVAHRANKTPSSHTTYTTHTEPTAHTVHTPSTVHTVCTAHTTHTAPTAYTAHISPRALTTPTASTSPTAHTANTAHKALGGVGKEREAGHRYRMCQRRYDISRKISVKKALESRKHHTITCEKNDNLTEPLVCPQYSENYKYPPALPQKLWTPTAAVFNFSPRLMKTSAEPDHVATPRTTKYSENARTRNDEEIFDFLKIHSSVDVTSSTSCVTSVEENFQNSLVAPVREDYIPNLLREQYNRDHNLFRGRKQGEERSVNKDRHRVLTLPPCPPTPSPTGDKSITGKATHFVCRKRVRAFGQKAKGHTLSETFQSAFHLPTGEAAVSDQVEKYSGKMDNSLNKVPDNDQVYVANIPHGTKKKYNFSRQQIEKQDTSHQLSKCDLGLTQESQKNQKVAFNNIFSPYYIRTNRPHVSPNSHCNEIFQAPNQSTTDKLPGGTKKSSKNEVARTYREIFNSQRRNTQRVKCDNLKISSESPTSNKYAHGTTACFESDSNGPHNAMTTGKDVGASRDQQLLGMIQSFFHELKSSVGSDDKDVDKYGCATDVQGPSSLLSPPIEEHVHDLDEKLAGADGQTLSPHRVRRASKVDSPGYLRPTQSYKKKRVKSGFSTTSVSFSNACDLINKNRPLTKVQNTSLKNAQGVNSDMRIMKAKKISVRQIAKVPENIKKQIPIQTKCAAISPLLDLSPDRPMKNGGKENSLTAKMQIHAKGRNITGRNEIGFNNPNKENVKKLALNIQKENNQRSNQKLNDKQNITKRKMAESSLVRVSPELTKETEPKLKVKWKKSRQEPFPQSVDVDKKLQENLVQQKHCTLRHPDQRALNAQSGKWVYAESKSKKWQAPKNTRHAKSFSAAMARKMRNLKDGSCNLVGIHREKETKMTRFVPDVRADSHHKPEGSTLVRAISATRQKVRSHKDGQFQQVPKHLKGTGTKANTPKSFDLEAVDQYVPDMLSMPTLRHQQPASCSLESPVRPRLQKSGEAQQVASSRRQPSSPTRTVKPTLSQDIDNAKSTARKTMPRQQQKHCGKAAPSNTKGRCMAVAQGDGFTRDQSTKSAQYKALTSWGKDISLEMQKQKGPTPSPVTSEIAPRDLCLLSQDISTSSQDTYIRKESNKDTENVRPILNYSRMFCSLSPSCEVYVDKLRDKYLQEIKSRHIAMKPNEKNAPMTKITKFTKPWSWSEHRMDLGRKTTVSVDDIKMILGTSGSPVSASQSAHVLESVSVCGQKRRAQADTEDSAPAVFNNAVELNRPLPVFTSKTRKTERTKQSIKEVQPITTQSRHHHSNVTKRRGESGDRKLSKSSKGQMATFKSTFGDGNVQTSVNLPKISDKKLISNLPRKRKHNQKYRDKLKPTSGGKSVKRRNDKVMTRKFQVTEEREGSVMSQASAASSQCGYGPPGPSPRARSNSHQIFSILSADHESFVLSKSVPKISASSSMPSLSPSLWTNQITGENTFALLRAQYKIRNGGFSMKDCAHGVGETLCEDLVPRDDSCPQANPSEEAHTCRQQVGVKDRQQGERESWKLQDRTLSISSCFNLSSVSRSNISKKMFSLLRSPNPKNFDTLNSNRRLTLGAVDISSPQDQAACKKGEHCALTTSHHDMCDARSIERESKLNTYNVFSASEGQDQLHAKVDAGSPTFSLHDGNTLLGSDRQLPSMKDKASSSSTNQGSDAQILFSHRTREEVETIQEQQALSWLEQISLSSLSRDVTENDKTAPNSPIDDMKGRKRSRSHMHRPTVSLAVTRSSVKDSGWPYPRNCRRGMKSYLSTLRPIAKPQTRSEIRNTLRTSYNAPTNSSVRNTRELNRSNTQQVMGNIQDLVKTANSSSTTKANAEKEGHPLTDLATDTVSLESRCLLDRTANQASCAWIPSEFKIGCLNMPARSCGQQPLSFAQTVMKNNNKKLSFTSESLKCKDTIQFSIGDQSSYCPMLQNKNTGIPKQLGITKSGEISVDNTSADASFRNLTLDEHLGASNDVIHSQDTPGSTEQHSNSVTIDNMNTGTYTKSETSTGSQISFDWYRPSFSSSHPLAPTTGQPPTQLENFSNPVDSTTRSRKVAGEYGLSPTRIRGDQHERKPLDNRQFPSPDVGSTLLCPRQIHSGTSSHHSSSGASFNYPSGQICQGVNRPSAQNSEYVVISPAKEAAPVNVNDSFQLPVGPQLDQRQRTNYDNPQEKPSEEVSNQLRRILCYENNLVSSYSELYYSLLGGYSAANQNFHINWLRARKTEDGVSVHDGGGAHHRQTVPAQDRVHNINCYETISDPSPRPKAD